LREPVTEKGVTYAYGIRITPKERVGYVLKAEAVQGRKGVGMFNPTYLVRIEEGKEAPH
jgi:hypothetical protein